MLGDLKHGRTVHSLARLLTLFDVKINYVAPDVLRMPEEVIHEVNEKKIPQTEYVNLDACLAESDVLYVTRVQKERFPDEAAYEAVSGSYVIGTDTMAKAKEEMIVMHPLPRVNEIAMEVDDDPRAAYFRQMEYGLYIRMALLALVLGKV
jgi:aspartate carbamoyltransferase catalytic subunit